MQINSDQIENVFVINNIHYKFKIIYLNFKWVNFFFESNIFRFLTILKMREIDITLELQIGLYKYRLKNTIFFILK